MNKIILLTLPLMGVSCALSQGNAPTQPFETGMSRVSLGLNQFGTSTFETPGAPDLDVDSLAVNFTYGYFVMPEVEVGGRLGYSDTEIGAVSATTYTIDAYGRYYWDTSSQMRPWVQAFIGVGSADDDGIDSDIAQYGIGIGATNMISDSTSLDFGLEYQGATIETPGFQDVDASGLSASVFFSIFYGN
jgi:hypothetical protein